MAIGLSKPEALKENDSVVGIVGRRNAGCIATNWYNHWLVKRKLLDERTIL